MFIALDAGADRDLPTGSFRVSNLRYDYHLGQFSCRSVEWR
jgi:hypothetical protein